jgi:predicted metal-dependent phosphotriesterase family hydrolase
VYCECKEMKVYRVCYDRGGVLFHHFQQLGVTLCHQKLVIVMIHKQYDMHQNRSLQQKEVVKCEIRTKINNIF